MPKVSIVLPIYNSEQYIKESIDSIINQTFEDWELLAIYDSGTTDETPKILKDYEKKDSRIKSICIEENGIVSALNFGIKMARGKYIARMDADDIAYSNKFEEQLKYFKENKDVDIVGTFIECIGLDDSKNRLYEEWFNESIDDDSHMIKKAVHGCPIAHPTVMFKKEIMLSLGGYRDLVAGEDYDLWLNAIKKGYKIRNIPKRLLKYRVHEEAKSAKEQVNDENIKAKINIKMSFIRDKVRNDKKFKYFIWGAGGGGLKSYDIIKNCIPNANMLGFVDKFKNGTLEDFDIFKPKDILNKDYDYIFIATEPGRNEAEEFLKSINKEILKDYIYIL